MKITVVFDSLDEFETHMKISPALEDKLDEVLQQDAVVASDNGRASEPEVNETELRVDLSRIYHDLCGFDDMGFQFAQNLLYSHTQMTDIDSDMTKQQAIELYRDMHRIANIKGIERYDCESKY